MGFVWIDDKEDDEKFKGHLATKIDEATTTLANTNKGLLADVKKLKKKVKEKEDISVDEYNTLKTENEQLKNSKREGETEIEKQARIAKEQHEADMKKLNDKIEKMESRDRKNLVDSHITEGLVEIKVKSSLMKAAKKIIESDVTVTEDEAGNKVAMVGDKTIKEHIVWWSETDEGKNFVVATKNNGGDSSGNDSKQYSSSDFEKYYDKKSGQTNITQQILLSKNNPTLHAKLATKHGSSVPVSS